MRDYLDILTCFGKRNEHRFNKFAKARFLHLAIANHKFSNILQSIQLQKNVRIPAVPFDPSPEIS